MAINYFEDFNASLNQRFTADKDTTPTSDWITKHTTINGASFNFTDYPFQVGIVNDWHPNLSCIKPSQQGLTEVQLRKAMSFVRRNRGVKLMFTLPDENLQTKVAQGRLQPILQSDLVFNKEKVAGMGQVRSTDTHQIGTSFLYLVKCGESEATSTPSDVVINDEVDLSDQQVLSLFQSRMQASKWKINQRFSTPTFEGYGISADFDLSDQREYFCRCPKCNFQQIPQFDDDSVKITGWNHDVPIRELTQAYVEKSGIDIFKAQVVCIKCGSPMLKHLGDGLQREWVARFPNRVLARGYRVLPFSAANLSPAYILTQLFAYQKRDFIRGWFNTVLGETYETGDIRLREADIMSCFGTALEVEAYQEGENYFLGIDIGLVAHVVLLRGRNHRNVKAVGFYTVPADKLVDQVKTLNEKYHIKQGGTDRHPYTPTANSLFEVTNGVVLPMEYRGDKEISDKLEHEKKLQVDRTELLDSVAHLVRNQTLTMTGYGSQQETIKNHLRDMTRDETPEKKATWKKLTGQDHYFHALGFGVTAMKFYYGDFIGAEIEMPKTTIFVGRVDIDVKGVGQLGLQRQGRGAGKSIIQSYY